MNDSGAKPAKSSDKKSSKRSRLAPPTPDRRKAKMKFHNFSAKDQRKASKLVTDIVENLGDYICLSCGIHVASYRDLVTHKKKCSELEVRMVGAGLERSEPKLEQVETDSELSNYLTSKDI